MKTDEHLHLPLGITEYIREQFREDFLFAVKKIFVKNGLKHYLVQVSKDDFIHMLTFDERGRIVVNQTDPAFPSDPREGLGFGETPE